MGAFFDKYKNSSITDRQDEGREIDVVILKCLREYPNKYFKIWVKRFDNDDVHVEMSRGVTTYTYIYKVAKDNEYSFQYFYQEPCFYHYIDNRAEKLPIFHTYEAVGDYWAGERFNEVELFYSNEMRNLADKAIRAVGAVCQQKVCAKK